MVSVYFAGELFSLKHLAGNALLADAIGRISNGRFVCVLPQTLEDRAMTAQEIRDQDIVALLECELAIFSFDGPELDSGTVSEFMLSKFADLPCLLLRTDFRRGGDQGNDPWNLMLSFYPRTRSLFLNSLEIYKAGIAEGLSPVEATTRMVQDIAQAIITELELLSRLSSRMDGELAEPVFRWLSQLAGFASPGDEQKVLKLFTRRKEAALPQN